MSKCITNNHLKLEYIFKSQIINQSARLLLLLDYFYSNLTKCETRVNMRNEPVTLLKAISIHN